MATDGSGGSAPLEVTITRVIAAPRAQVWAAWTDPDHVRHWGPSGFSVEIIHQELWPGGEWQARLRPAGGGEDLWQGGNYREVVEGERLVYSFAWDDDEGPDTETEVTLLLEDDGAGTRLTFRHAGFATSESRDSHAGGWTEALDALSVHAGSLHPGT